MIKQIMYTYLGTNGTVCTPIHLEGIYFIKKYKLTALDNCVLTKDGIEFKKSVLIPEDELDQWYEIEK